MRCTRPGPALSCGSDARRRHPTASRAAGCWLAATRNCPETATELPVGLSWASPSGAVSAAACTSRRSRGGRNARLRPCPPGDLLQPEEVRPWARGPSPRAVVRLPLGGVSRQQRSGHPAVVSRTACVGGAIRPGGAPRRGEDQLAEWGARAQHLVTWRLGDVAVRRSGRARQPVAQRPPGRVARAQPRARRGSNATVDPRPGRAARRPRRGRTRRRRARSSAPVRSRRTTGCPGRPAGRSRRRRRAATSDGDPAVSGSASRPSRAGSSGFSRTSSPRRTASSTRSARTGSPPDVAA